MSAAAPTSPAVVRTPSTSRRAQGAPHRAQSTTTRPSSHSSAAPHRTLSQSQAHGRPSSSQQSSVARRDFEQAAPLPSSARRSEDRERTNGPPTPSRTDSTRSNHHPPSQPRHARYASDASTTNGTGPASSSRTPATVPPANPNRGRRTTIESSTGQWALGKTIGAGSMGKVKLAKNVETGEQVAVKIIPRQSTDEHRTQAERERADHSKEIRTAREAAIVSLVNHPYICGMRDVVRTNYHWYMLFEYVNGGQMLDYIISHGRLKEKQARRFGRQVASALDYCHRNSIVHRDLKIENILISKTGDIKIIDFGLSNLFAPRSHLKTFCGSLYFAAPELLQAKHYTGPEVDVWSFGIVLYVLVCGKVPFDDQSMPQLHAKIKKGNVEYPPWLTAECKNLISRMLVTDSRQRASLSEIMNHPWMTKGYNGPPENFLPHREPLQLPLDPEVVQKMTGFDFGTPEFITAELTKVIESDDYQNAVRLAARKQVSHTPETEQKRGVFNFYKRRNSTTSRDTLTNPSADTLQLGVDPINAYSPLISVYYLVREKIQRERAESNPGALAMPSSPGEKSLKMPDLPAPEAAYTNPQAYEMAGEAPTGGRSRPRARTHGEDEVSEDIKRLNLSPPAGPVSPAIITPPIEQTPAKKESTAGALLRRFSTRRHKEPARERELGPPLPPAVAVSSPTDNSTTPRKSFSVRRPREKEAPASLHPPSASHQPELLSPPSVGSGAARKLKALGRSTSVNSAELRRRMTRRTGSGNDPPPTSGSDRSSLSEKQRPAEDAASDETPTTIRRAVSSRAKSLGHARRESIQARRARRDMARDNEVLAETDAEGYDAPMPESRSPDTMKPVYLKGLFSVSTTSSKPLSFIRSDIIRVLKQLGVEYREIKGGFSCRHAPSIDLNKAQDTVSSPSQPLSNATGHRRKISFGGFKGSERERERDEFREAHRSPQTPKSTASRQRSKGVGQGDASCSPSEASIESDTAREDPQRASGPRARPAGETTTHVQSDMGGSMILEFEIVIVKVPLLSLHGIQFKKVEGGTWQYKNMAQKILDGLRL